MLTLENITTEENKSKIRIVLKSYYDEAFGNDWASMLKSEKLKNLLYNAQISTNSEMKQLFDTKKSKAFAIKNDDEEIGQVILELIDDNNIGAINSLYIYPKYRKFFDSFNEECSDNIRQLSLLITNYFKDFDVQEIIMDAPHNINDSDLLAEEMGFKATKVYSDATGFNKKIK